MTHSYNSCTKEEGRAGKPEVPGQLRRHSKFRLGCRVKTLSYKNKQKTLVYLNPLSRSNS